MKKLIFLLALPCFLHVDADAQFRIFRKIKGTKNGFGVQIDSIVTPPPPPPPEDTTPPPPPAPTIKSGVMVLTSSSYPTIPSRITRSKYVVPVDSPYFRYNFTIGDVYRVPQIIDSGCKVALTFGFADPSDFAPFPTDTASFANSLRAVLAVKKAHRIYLINEPPNTNYWDQGTTNAQIAASAHRWVNLYNAGIKAGHAYGVPTGDGGLLFSVVYHYWRYLKQHADAEAPGVHIYKDSLQRLIDATGITSINGTYAQQRLAWYDVVLPAIAASDADFVNIHWYEPLRTDTSSTTVSNVFTWIVNYLHMVTGKKVETHEFGTHNHSKQLLWEFLDEMKYANIEYQIYFAGDGSEAVDLSEYYRQWQLVH